MNPVFMIKIEINKINNKTSYKNIKKWDSLNHVKLIMAIESKFRGSKRKSLRAAFLTAPDFI